MTIRSMKMNLKIKANITKPKGKRLRKANSFFDKRKCMKSPPTVKHKSAKFVQPTVARPQRARFLSPKIRLRATQVQDLNMTVCSQAQENFMSKLDEKVKVAKASRFKGFLSPVALKRKLFDESFSVNQPIYSDSAIPALPDLSSPVESTTRRKLFKVDRSNRHHK